MKNCFLIFALLVISFFLYGQETHFDYETDFKVLRELSNDSGNILYYPHLIERFTGCDTTLTNAEILAMMIGFTENSNYKPYKTLTEEREMLSQLQDQKYEEAIRSSNSFLVHNPLNFTALITKSIAYIELARDSTEFHKNKFIMILDAVISSGTGTIENPYFVLNPMDGQILVRYIFGGSIGMMGSARDNNNNFLDMLEMSIEGQEPVHLYFQIDHATEKMFTPAERERMNQSFSSKKKGKKKDKHD